MRVWGSEKYNNHFIGWILYVIEEWTTFGGVLTASVIDGQQRLTTCSLLLYALAEISREIWNEQSYNDIMQWCIINTTKSWDLKYKLMPTKLDKEKYIAVIEGTEMNDTQDSNIINNYRYFKNQILKNIESIEVIYKGIAKLFIVDIALDRNQDNPQLIFESMNSTWLALSKAELIKNYLLMWLRNEEQALLYEQYWYPIDKVLENNSKLYDMFIRDYLTFKNPSWKIPAFRFLYDEFKKFLKSEKKEVVEVLKDIYSTFSIYARLTLLKEEKDPDIAEVLNDIERLKVNVAYPFMIELFYDYENAVLAKQELIKILRLIESYVFRRAICAIPTNSMNKTFATLKKSLKKDTSKEYYESFAASLISLESYKAFPSDELFAADLRVKDIYNFRNCKYLLEKLENHDKKEKILAENYTIEHIMPQSTKNNQVWQKEIWEDRKEVYDKYLHTIWNISLTWYNSEYSDRSFQEKKNLEGKWFNYSPIGLNGMIRQCERRDREAIESRAEVLSNLAKKVWSYESLNQATLSKYTKKDTTIEKTNRSYDNHKHLKGEVWELYHKVRWKILALHPDVKEEIQKLYIAFKYQTNFVDIEVQKQGLRMTLNMDFEEIKDPYWICRDITGVGRRGNGNISVFLDDIDNIEHILFLIKQSFDKQFD